MTRKFGALRFAAIGFGLFATACGPQLGECKTTYTTEMQTAGQQIVLDVCRNCHDSSLTAEADRNKAPLDLNYDDLALVRKHAQKMYAEAEEGEMPPKNEIGIAKLTSTEVANLRAWLACGAMPLLPDAVWNQ